MTVIKWNQSGEGKNYIAFAVSCLFAAGTDAAATDAAAPAAATAVENSESMRSSYRVSQKYVDSY